MAENNVYLDYLKNNQEIVEKALNEKIKNKINEDQKKKLSILEKSITDSEAELDKVKKLLSEYYFDVLNNKDSTEKKQKFMEELTILQDKYKVENDGSGTKESLEQGEKSIVEKLDKMKDDMDDKTKKTKEVLDEFIKVNEEEFKKLNLSKDLNNFNSNISSMIKDIESKQKE